MTTTLSSLIALPQRRYLALLAFLLFLSGIAQLLLPTEVAAVSAFGAAVGWQREIAFFDLALVVLIARTLRGGDATGARSLVIALVFLQSLVALNHGVAALETRAPLNALMFWVNAGTAMLGATALLTDPRRRAVGDAG